MLTVTIDTTENEINSIKEEKKYALKGVII
jgi:hypothetical protein